jgi:hypothetical protein
LAIFNSKFNIIFRTYFSTIGREGLEFKKVQIETIPIVKPTKAQENAIIKLVDNILIDKEKNKDTTALESKIDRLVYELYDLAESEIKYIEEGK